MPATVRPAGRRKVQRPKFPPRVCDGPSCHFVTKFKESIFSTQFSVFLSVLERDTATVLRALDGPSWGPSLLPVFPELKSVAQND